MMRECEPNLLLINLTICELDSYSEDMTYEYVNETHQQSRTEFDSRVSFQDIFILTITKKKDKTPRNRSFQFIFIM